MQQTKLASLVEALLNTASGFLISMLVWQLIVAPVFGYEVTLSSNFAMTSIFTITSVARSYAWRRFFANGIASATLRYITKRKRR